MSGSVALQRSFGASMCLVAALLCAKACRAAGYASVLPVAVYAVPPCYTASPDYKVSVVPIGGGTEKTAATFEFTTGASNAVQYAYSEFSINVPVQVTITLLAPSSTITSYKISPAAFAIAGTSKGNALTFQLPSSRYLIVQINHLPQLVVAADPAETTAPVVGGDVQDVTAAPYNVQPDQKASSSTQTTLQINNAIKRASSVSGTVYVPPGVYYIDNISLLSNIQLYLAGGAVLRSSDNTKNMKVYFKKDSSTEQDGTALNGTWLISTGTSSDSKPNAAIATNGISITGRGIIDGDGYTMRAGTTADGGPHLLDTLIMPTNTTGFVVDGITAWNAGFWALTPARTSRLTIKNYKGLDALKIAGCPASGNGKNRLCMLEDDGIDISDSSNVLVNHTLIISADDAYSTKTWSDGALSKYWGGVPSRPIQNVLFTDVIGWSNEDAFKIGAGIVEPHTGVTFDHAYVYAARRALDINNGGGNAAVSNIIFQNVDIETTNTAASTVERTGLESWASIENCQASARPCASGSPIGPVSYSNIVIRKSSSQPYVAIKSFSPEPTNLTFSNIVNGDDRVTTAAALGGSSTVHATHLSVIP